MKDSLQQMRCTRLWPRRRDTSMGVASSQLQEMKGTLRKHHALDATRSCRTTSIEGKEGRQVRSSYEVVKQQMRPTGVPFLQP